MNIKVLTLSAAASTLIMAAAPMVSTSMSTDNGGTKFAIDAYSDGGGVLLINQAADTKFDNSAMNKLVFKYGDAAKSSNTTLKNQVGVLSTAATAIEKADATSKLETAKVVINPPVNGTQCDDGLSTTSGDVWLNGLCKGVFNDGVTCDDANPLTFADKYTNNICSGVTDGTSCDDQNNLTFADKYTSGVCAGVVDGATCSDNNPLTFLDKYTSGVCAGIANGTACNDSVAYTYADKYTSGICGGTTALSCKDIKTLTATTASGRYTVKPSTAFDVYCDMVTDGGGWTDVYRTFLNVDSSLAYRQKFFSNLNLTRAPIASAAGFYLTYGWLDGSDQHSVGIHLDLSLLNFKEVKMSYILQGQEDGTRCSSTNWVPLNGPGYNGGYGGYLAVCPVGRTCIQGSPTVTDTPISANYTNNAVTTQTLLTWSGSTNTGGDGQSTGCTRSATIPTSIVSLWFSQLLLR